MKEKTKNILRIILTVIDTIIHLFIKKHDDTCDSHPKLDSGSETEHPNP